MVDVTVVNTSTTHAGGHGGPEVGCGIGGGGVAAPGVSVLIAQLLR
jgi:hypothetical protein